MRPPAHPPACATPPSTAPQGYVAPEVCSGSLEYVPHLMHLPAAGATTAVDDRPAVPARAPQQQMWYNLAYERSGEVPAYNRALDAALGAARPSGRGSAAGEAAPAPTRRPSARAGGRCFNCGSYGHSLRECWREYDLDAIAAAKQALGAAGGGKPARYFSAAASDERDEGGAAAVRLEFPLAAPGQLSERLRAALGIGPAAPPPWLEAMRRLGPPPAAHCARPPPLPPLEDTPPPPRPPPPLPTGSAAAGEQQLGPHGGRGDGPDDFIPCAAAAEPAAVAGMQLDADGQEAAAATAASAAAWAACGWAGGGASAVHRPPGVAAAASGWAPPLPPAQEWPPAPRPFW